MSRPTSFALHIRPMFSDVDVQHMASIGPFSVDLTSHDEVKAKSGKILARLKGQQSLMPPESNGGPWPQEWIALFERWIAEEHPA